MVREKISGIYKIKNMVNGRIYIGSSKDLHTRINKHKNLLRKNKHENDYLQKSWNKYGEVNFEFEIIEIVNDLSQLLNREQYWIDYTNSSNRDIGYNLSPTAGSCLNLKHSEETKQKISELKKGTIPWNKGYGEYIKGSHNPMYGKTHSEPARERIRQHRLNSKASLDAKEKMYESSHKGESSNLSVLTDAQVLEIKTIIKYTDLFQREIGEMFGVNQRTISTIKTGKQWKHIDISDLLPDSVYAILEKYCISKRIIGIPQQLVCVCDENGVKCSYDINF